MNTLLAEREKVSLGEELRDVDIGIATMWHDAPLAAATSRAAVLAMKARGHSPDMIRAIIRNHSVVVD